MTTTGTTGNPLLDPNTVNPLLRFPTVLPPGSPLGGGIGADPSLTIPPSGTPAGGTTQLPETVVTAQRDPPSGFIGGTWEIVSRFSVILLGIVILGIALVGLLIGAKSERVPVRDLAGH